MDYKKVTHCRICKSKNLKKYLDLGEQPPPNNLITPYFPDNPEYPLQVLFCEDCALSQLSVVVDPKLMFSSYLYHSSVSKTFQKHCFQLGKKLLKMIGGEPGFQKELACVIDIAANDGCLLEQFRKAGFGWPIAVEPAENLAKKCREKGIPTHEVFWEQANIHYVDVITATNVLAHVDDVLGFMSKIQNTLTSFRKSFCVIEVPYLYDLLKNNQFDTVYHEHLSYFLFKPLKFLFEKCGLKVFKVERIDIHGGSLRVYAEKNNLFKVDKSVEKLLEFEAKKDLYNFAEYKSFGNKVEIAKDRLVHMLYDLFKKGKKVFGYGASAKGISFINYCKIDKRLICYIVDDTPEKQYKEIPGARIQIVPKRYVEREKPDCMVIFAWNFAKEIMKKTKFKGKWIIPIPRAKIL